MQASEEIRKPTKQEVLASVTAMLEGMENLPPHAMYAPVLYSDHLSLLLLLAASLRADLSD